MSVARLLQHQNGDGAALHVVTHEARAGALDDALAATRRCCRGARARRCRCPSSPSAASRSSDGRDLRRLVAVARRGLDAARARARGSRERLGVELHFKCEGLNPTGSFKDRGMAVAVAKAVEAGAAAVVCASTGNTAASAAAYAARAGRDAVVLSPAGATAGGEARAVARRRRARARGAGQLRRCARALPGARRAGRLRARQLAQPGPDRGAEDGASRSIEELGRAPDVLALPYGGGGNSSAVREGFRRGGRRAADDRRRRRPSARPRSRPRSASPSRRTPRTSPSSSPRAASSWSRSRTRRSRDAGATSPAGRRLLRAVVRRRARGAEARRALEPGSTVVCVLTGHGLKDTGGRRRPRRARRRADARGISEVLA